MCFSNIFRWRSASGRVAWCEPGACDEMLRKKKGVRTRKGGLLNCLLRVSAMIWVFGGLGAFSCFASLLLCSLLGHLWTCRLIGLPTSGSVQVFQPKGRRFAQAIQA